MPNKVLVVDDQAEVRKLVKMALELGDYAFFEAECGRGALELIEVERPQVVILDIMMPGEPDGYGVCREIKSRPDLAGTFVCLLTARGQRSDVERGNEVGADAYLVKPFSPTDLIGIVERASQARALSRSQG